MTFVEGDMKLLSEHSSNDPLVILVSLAVAIDAMISLLIVVSVTLNGLSGPIGANVLSGYAVSPLLRHAMLIPS